MSFVIFGYGRVSKKKLNQGIGAKKQLQPVTKFMNSYKNKVNNVLRTNLFYDSWSNISSPRPSFKKMIDSVKANPTVTVKNVLVFDKLSSLGRTLAQIKHFLKLAERNHVTVRVLHGHWNFDTNDTAFDFEKFTSMLNLKQSLLSEQMNEVRTKAHKNGGVKPRFFGKNKKHYIKIYNYLSKHTEKETAKHYRISIRTVVRIKKSGQLYYDLKK